MELRHLRYFVALAEELHFGRAAERLHIAQPPLSQQIRRLEEELGLVLLSRTKRRVELTPAGRVFLEEARRTLAQAGRAVSAAQRASRGEIGKLVVGFVGSATYTVLPRTLRVFRARFPDVELVLEELAPADQVTALTRGEMDVGFFRSAVPDDALVQETIFEEPFVVALPERHRLIKRPKVKIRELAGEPFLIFPRQLGAGFYDQIVSACQRAGFSPRVTQHANEMQTIVSLVAAGVGVALVPESVRNFRRPGVVYKAIREPAPKTAMTVAWRRRESSPVLRSFLNVVREVARQPTAR